MIISDVKIKRGNKAQLPQTAERGEPIAILDTAELYVGQGALSPLVKITDVLFVETKAELPAIGTEGKIYVVKSDVDNGNETTMYRWNTTDASYILASSSGKTTIKAGETILSARQIELVPGGGISLSPDAANGAITITSATSSADSISQLTKLGVTASSVEPKDVNIVIPATADFNRRPLEVLKFMPGLQNVVATEAAFDNADATDFQADAQVVFDGTMKLKTNYAVPMTDDGALGSGKKFSATVDLNEFKKVEGLNVT